ncbi:MAG: hypothetical protein M5U01_21010 [Ardenticatenaceae bacterium]|nr:hypothetical protein [Ardenticatenaceae bacterium]
MTQAITIKLSNKTYDQLKQVAELSRQPLDTIVEQSLAHSLPPLLEDIPPDYQADVYPLLQMSDAELMEEAKRRFPADGWAEYEALLRKKKEFSLTSQEQVKLDTLRHEADVLMFRKGYAAVLLKRRGRRLPSLDELKQAQ